MTRAAASAKTKPPDRWGILLVDDNADDQLIFQLAWEKSMPGHPLRLVGSRREAMEYLRGQGKFADRTTFPFPSVIVLDLRLPDGSGAELVRWIRSQAGLNRLTVVILSGSANESDVQQAYSYGANSFLLKSAKPKDLQQTVQLIRAHWCSQNVSPELARSQL